VKIVYRFFCTTVNNQHQKYVQINNHYKCVIHEWQCNIRFIALLLLLLCL